MHGLPNRLTLLLLVWMAAARAMATGADQVIVFDVSNSMWGQVEGRAKIDIARQVIGGLVAEWPKSRRIGLVAYGHRRAGDCTDIEPLIPVGPIDKARFTAIVNRLQPRGKTPLAEAVRQAAEILGYKDRPATVILVSDGLESCNADPCALAESLEIGGVDFTAHVIGFDISSVQDQRQLGCLAEATGGRFLTAANAQELEDALKAASGLRQPTPASLNVSEAQLKVPKQVRIGAAFPVQWDGPDQSGDYLSIARPGDVIGRYYKHARTTDGNPATLRAPDYPGIYQVRYVHGPTHRITGSAQLLVVDVAAELGAPAEAGVGRSVRVDWIGPEGKHDYITVVRQGAGERKFGDYAYTRNGSPSQLQLPDNPGAYEIRYVTGQARRVLASQSILVREEAASLSAADSVLIGSVVQVEWTGPGGKQDYINVVSLDAKEGSIGNYVYTRNGSPTKLRMPEQPGDYEIRYVTGQERRILARLHIRVQPVETRLAAVAAASIGARVEVDWTGPGNRKDFITVVPLGTPERKLGHYVYARDGSQVKLLMPDHPGDYEIRYLTGKERQVLARRPIRIDEVEATLVAPISVAIGSRFKVVWSGPDGRKDYIAINETGSPDKQYKGYAYTRHGSPLSMQAPNVSGDYELRYVTGQTRRVLARRSLVVSGTAE